MPTLPRSNGGSEYFTDGLSMTVSAAPKGINPKSYWVKRRALVCMVDIAILVDCAFHKGRAISGMAYSFMDVESMEKVNSTHHTRMFGAGNIKRGGQRSGAIIPQACNVPAWIGAAIPLPLAWRHQFFSRPLAGKGFSTRPREASACRTTFSNS
jgi:hypothetical protein